jgi:hypothetical protein
VISHLYCYKKFFFIPPKERRKKKKEMMGRSGEMEKWWKECGGSGK